VHVRQKGFLSLIELKMIIYNYWEGKTDSRVYTSTKMYDKKISAFHCNFNWFHEKKNKGTQNHRITDSQNYRI